MKNFLTLLFIMVISVTMYSQDNPQVCTKATVSDKSTELSCCTNSDGFDVTAGIFSAYNWRGLNFGGNTPVVQGALSYTNSGFEVQSWLNSSFDSDYTQLINSVSYQTPFGANVGVTDYFQTFENNFFDFDDRDGDGHTVELNVGYEISDFEVSISYPISGWDGFYADVSYEFLDNTIFEVAVGDGIYSRDDLILDGDFGLVNVALSHTKQVCKGLGVFGQVGVNPSRERVYATVGVQF